jgi:hypothetical protein
MSEDEIEEIRISKEKKRSIYLIVSVLISIGVIITIIS